MKHIECEAMATLVKALYDEVYMPRQGAVSITPLAMPNAILIVGRPENVKTVKDLVARLDQPAVPGAQFQVFHLKYAAAGRGANDDPERLRRSRRIEPGGPRHGGPADHLPDRPGQPPRHGRGCRTDSADRRCQIETGRSTRCGSSAWNTRSPRTSPRSCRQAIGISTGGTGQAAGAVRADSRRPGRTARRARRASSSAQGGQPPGQGQNAGHRRVAGKTSSGPPCSAFSRSMPRAAGC